MDKYIITIANQKIEVWAKNHKSAMKKAIKTETGTAKIFGMLCTCLKHGDDEEDELLFGLPYMQNNGYFKGMEFKTID